MSPKYINLPDRAEYIGAAEPLCAPVGDGYTVLEIRPSDEGATVTVTLSEGNERVSVHLLVEQYADLRLREGRISDGEAETILEAGRLCDSQTERQRPSWRRVACATPSARVCDACNTETFPPAV